MIWHLGSEQNHVEKFSDSIFGLRATFGQIKNILKSIWNSFITVGIWITDFNLSATQIVLNATSQYCKQYSQGIVEII